jgi:hypothetical protein
MCCNIRKTYRLHAGRLLISHFNHITKYWVEFHGPATAVKLITGHKGRAAAAKEIDNYATMLATIHNWNG